MFLLTASVKKYGKWLLFFTNFFVIRTLIFDLYENSELGMEELCYNTEITLNSYLNKLRPHFDHKRKDDSDILKFILLSKMSELA
jgi:hypothetical protein